MIGVGSIAPDFEGREGSGGTVRLSAYRGRPVVLYFFPKAFTGGCTTETKGFAALAPELAPHDVAIIGVSVDTADTQARFAAECRAAFPIVADADRSIARAYGVLSFLGVAKRVTFFLDGEGVVQDVVASILPGPHLERTRARYVRTR